MQQLAYPLPVHQKWRRLHTASTFFRVFAWIELTIGLLYALFIMSLSSNGAIFSGLLLAEVITLSGTFLGFFLLSALSEGILLLISIEHHLQIRNERGKQEE